MVDVPVLDPSEAPRARRWDALVLGSGVAALVAAARISAAGQRVLVVEEEARTTLPPAMKEPFFLGGYRDQGLLDATLRTLTVPLIDRRRIGSERLAYQVAADPYRLDVGQPIVTADELVTWGLAKPDEAQTLVRHLVESGEIERTLLYESPFVRLGRRLPGVRSAGGSPPGAGNHKRGLPGAVASADGDLAKVFDAEVRALSNLGASRPSPECQARLLALGLAGGAGFADDPPWLVDLLRKRVTALYGDMRTLSGAFELVSVSGQPGIRVMRTGEIWLGRVLVLGASRSALADQYDASPGHTAPGLLEAARVPAGRTASGRGLGRAYRAALLYRVPTEILPEGMGARLILPGANNSEPTLAVTAYPCTTQIGRVDLVARGVMVDVTPETLAERRRALGQQAHERLSDLMPFCGDALQTVEVAMPGWDSDDGWLEDPAPGQGWPAEIDLRLSSRPPIYHLDRAAAAGLGLEGDCLLGWRGGDAIAEELA